ncbi:Lrp/AsnC family transcriptional regulator [Ornithobacterium rhinotracheale]|uniref:Transcriptional regulator n=1 Tax=Ornithobacterium rhinotracheale (strain ATCC 51463 / DSM 15997 / CCUG 23171 / CIP 104009 / LMG 9086) TaxID=867902 RepID=I3ZXL2_ORNRL|nr:winged helix-turn-helix transcriptional regulator [Ornithobacterium rhinotracheale]AFL96446.1 transcriptional regulator [Ornithobacterium rhinotracheale DSM 15997]AIP98657.1 transcriptional regulator [Ornithobacterium rhinotracheale ORT-UMN 88]MBN3662171.1 winged helix-turn-helix transcriptional regulator [Ornithobacterium rhinotracheale]MCK0194774.1 winged helix-turn-helix transcriptional regulator [Ornithobacterium rhinotracheale]MCK0200759.1 winged helix-turn-helix transcriptional regula
MRPTYKIDEVDKRILRYLIENTRMPFTEIAKKMDVSAGTIHVRVKKLEDAGIIKGSTLNIDYSKMGYDFVAYVGIMLTKSNRIQEVLQRLKKIPNITVASVISGKYNIFCKIRAKDTRDAKEVIYKIDEIEDVLRTESMISLDEEINDKTRLLSSIFM